MKKNTFKRIGALLLAGALAAGMSFSALAATNALGSDTSLIDGTTVISNYGVQENGAGVDSDSNGTNDTATFTAVGNTVSFTKDIIVFNSDSKTVYHPNVDYTYTISPVGTAGTAIGDTTKITDEFNTSAKVLGGVAVGSAVSSPTTSISFTDTNTIATTNAGAVISGTGSFTFVPTAFPHAGIYRYLITETEGTKTRANAGVISGTGYNNKRYLDVYLKNNDAGTALEVYGYVLYEGESTAAFTASGTIAAKTNGFVEDNPSTLTTTTDCDYYWTVNLDVAKTVTGQLGDKTHEFGFEIALSTVSSFAKATYSDNSTNASSGTTALTSGAGTVACTLNSGSKMTIVGLPMGTTATVTETNTALDTYTVSAAHDNGATLTVNSNATASVAAGGTGAVNALYVYNTTDNATPVDSGQIASTAVTDTIDTITVTNALNAVSPTGYVARFAPFAIMLGFAFVLLFLKRRKNENESDMI